MKRNLRYSVGVVCFLALATVVSRCDMSPVCVASSLFALCFLAMLGFGWISTKKKNPESH